MRNDSDDFARFTNLADGIFAVAMTSRSPFRYRHPRGARKSYSTAIAVLELLLDIREGFELDPTGCSLSLSTMVFRRPVEDRP
jgi:hypothetical protein